METKKTVTFYSVIANNIPFTIDRSILNEDGKRVPEYVRDHLGNIVHRAFNMYRWDTVPLGVLKNDPKIHMCRIDINEDMVQQGNTLQEVLDTVEKLKKANIYGIITPEEYERSQNPDAFEHKKALQAEKNKNAEMEEKIKKLEDEVKRGRR